MVEKTVCVLTAYTGNFDKLAAVAMPLMQQYADRWGYDFRAKRYDRAIRTRAWLKIDSIIEALNGRYDAILWLDIDTILVRTDVSVASVLREEFHLYMVWHDFEEGFPFPPHFNSGVMIIRNNAWSKDFFKRVWDGEVSHPHWSDQAAILNLLGFDDASSSRGRDEGNVDRARVCAIDCDWNVIIGITRYTDPIVHHYAGMDLEMRLNLMALDQGSLAFRRDLPPQGRAALTGLIGAQRDDLAGLLSAVRYERDLAQRRFDRTIEGTVKRLSDPYVRGLKRWWR